MKQYKKDRFNSHEDIFLEDKTVPVVAWCEIGGRTDEGCGNRDFVAHLYVFIFVYF